MNQVPISRKQTQQKLFKNRNNIHRNKKIPLKQQTYANHNVRINQNGIPNPMMRRVSVGNNVNHLRRVSLQQKQTISNPIPIKTNYDEYYSLKEILKLGIDVANTKKVFINGESKYIIDKQKVNNNITNLNADNFNQNSNHSSIDDMFVNDEASDVNSAHYDYEQENEQNLEFQIEENDNSKIVTNKEFVEEQYQNKNNVEEVSQSNEINVYDDEFHHSEEELSDSNAVYDVQDLNFNESSEYFDDVDYVQEYYDDTFQDAFEQVEYDKQIDYEEKIRPLQIVKNWNKKLWRPEDVLYKIYNISFNQNHTDPYAGCLYNFSFDIYPGDRIAILAHDSMSDLLLLDILKNYVPKESGYVFFNLKREQKWFDIYSSEFDGFDIEMYNRRYEAIYQLQSPDYLSYGKNKNDTVDSTFKKIFNTVKQVINEKLFNDLLYLLDFENDLNTLISQLDDLKIRKFVFICDVLIGKKIIIMSNLTQGFDLTQKISFYRYINALYQDSDTVIIFNVKDSFEVKLLANRLIIIDDGEPVVNKRVKDILNTFETLDTFIFEAFDKLHKKYL